MNFVIIKLNCVYLFKSWCVLFSSLQCLYCERIFKDKTVLKEHMRKKQHKKINPKNRKYDKFYVINYLVGVHLSPVNLIKGRFSTLLHEELIVLGNQDM